jgi:hypothetical protein
MQYVHDAGKFPEWLVGQVNNLRILCNKAAHDEGFECEASQLDSAAHVIWKLLEYLKPDAAYLNLQAYCLQRNAGPFPDLPTAPKESFHCVINSWKTIQQDGKDSALEITAVSEDGDQVSILMKNSSDTDTARKWTLLGKSLWKYAVLACYNLTKAAGRPNSYLSNPNTLIAVEPDFLMDASSIAECFSTQGMNPELFVVGRIMTDSGSENLVRGSVVNDVFDSLVFDPDDDYNELFRNSLAKHPMSMVALGKQSALDMHNTIRQEHLAQLQTVARSMRNHQLMLEPTYICPRYGLQGRLDLLYVKDGKHYILELKSGKAPGWDVWPQHQMQVVAYNMIIRGCYGAKGLGTSSIFYSADGGNSLRHVVNTAGLEQGLLMCRNRIVGIMQMLSREPERFFDWLKGIDTSSLAGFSRDKINRLKELFASLEPYEYEWFLQQVKLTVREAWYTKTGSNGLRDDGIYGYNALWQQSRVEKQRHYKIITGLRLLEATRNNLRFSLDVCDAITDFRQGDIVVLYRESTPVDRQEILRGSIKELEDSILEVSVRGGIHQAFRNYTQETWALEHDILESTLLSPLNSIRSFLEGPAVLRARVLGIQRPESEAWEPHADHIEDMIVRMRAAKDYFVVQGPPGTGKTSGLITRFISSLFAETDEVVLVLSFTNRAVDEICLNLDKKEVQYLRTGQSAVIDEQLLGNRIAGKRFDEIDSIVRSNRIWVSTVQSCNAWINDFLRICGRIDTLIVDEASQIIENTILGIISRAGKTILIGDQNQLPPIVVQNQAVYNLSSGELKSLQYSTFNRSLMERLWLVAITNGWHEACEMLHHHYRMHDEIAELIQQNYLGKLVSSTERQSSPLPCRFHAHPVFGKRAVWIECPPSTTAYYDDLQVDCVIHLLEQFRILAPEADFQTAIGIVSPYRAMIHALRKKLGDIFAGITIDTVERFQGSERDNIILVLPLQNPASLRTMEAVSDDGTIDRKLNVALSRAKERVIIIGNEGICRTATHYAAILDRIMSQGNTLPIEELLT